MGQFNMPVTFLNYMINEGWEGRLVAIATTDKQNDGAHDIQYLSRVWKLAQRLLVEYLAAY